MTKKQCGIIFTLLTLILCVGMLAAKLNKGGLNDPTDLSQVSTIQSLKAIISDENTSQENKDDATKKLTKKTMVRENEGRIELGIKNKGYEDALCMLEDSKATVIIKSSKPIEQKDSVDIQEIVQNVSNIKDVIIEVQK